MAISDRVEFEAWLQGRPQAVAVALATRAAMRAVPLFLKAVSRPRLHELTRGQVLRACLVSGVAAGWPTSELSQRLVEAAATSAAGATASSNAAFGVAASDAASDASDAAAAAAAAAGAAAATTAGAAATAAVTTAAAAAAAARAAAFAGRSAATAATWNELSRDCDRIDGGGQVVGKPLWATAPPAGVDLWPVVRADLTGRSGWEFWIEWYDSLLAGRPMNPDLLTEIALIDPKDWDKGDDHVNAIIAGIVERHRGSISPMEAVEREASRLAPATLPIIATVRMALQQNRAQLPPAFEAVLGFIQLEVGRLQGRNWQSDPERDEGQRQISTLLTIHAALVAIQSAVPAEGPVAEASAEKVERFWRVFGRKFAEWPRTNADDLVDSSCRFAIVGSATLLAPLLGVSALTAFIGAGAFFGGKKIADAVKLASDAKKLVGGGP